MRRIPPYRFPFARYPALRLAVLLTLGILSGKLELLSPQLAGIASGMLLCLSILLEWINRHSLRPVTWQLSTLSYLLAVCAFGAASAARTAPDRSPPGTALWMQQFEWEQFHLSGTLRAAHRVDSMRSYLDLQVDSIFTGSRAYAVPSFGIRGLLKKHRPGDLPPSGVRMHATITVYPLEDPRNPGDFNYRQFLYEQGLFLQGGIEDRVVFEGGPRPGGWIRIRNTALEAIGRIFPKRTAPLARALLIGYKNELPRDQRRAFSRAGLAHLMAVSGLHVGFLVAPFWLCIPMLRRRRLSALAALPGLASLLIFYAGLTGFSSSVTRASLMAVLLAYARLFGKPSDSVNLASAAAVLILLLEPTQLFDIGFQLSFGAVFTILLTWPVLMHYLPDWIRFRWYGKPVGILLLSLVVQLGLFPLVAWYFGEFSLIGPLMNAVFVIPLGIAIPWSMACTLLSAIGLPGAALLNLPAAWAVGLLHRAVTAVNAYDAAWMNIQLTDHLLFLTWALGLLWLASWRNSRLRWKMAAFFVASLCLWQGGRTVQKFQPHRLRIVMFDVGQGDATLVRTPAGRHLLIDTGRWRPGYSSGASVILPYLRSRGIERLEAVVLTHPHADHIGGIEALLAGIRIDTVYNSGFPYQSALFRRYHRQAREQGVPVKAVHAGQAIPLDPALQLWVLGPDFRPHRSEPNEHSVVLLMAYGHNRFLFMGDGGRIQEKGLIRHYGDLLDADFLKVGHHASRTASSRAFLETVTAQIAAVSLGMHNRYRHPHASAVSQLLRQSRELDFTSLGGALVYESDGDSLYKIPWK